MAALKKAEAEAMTVEAIRLSPAATKAAEQAFGSSSVIRPAK
jgi:hypothetical protein